MTTALKIAADGSQTTVEVNKLEDYQREVGGYIQTLPLGEKHILIINEEGKIRELAPNSLATALTSIFHSGIAYHDYIAGDALIVGENGDNWVDIDPSMRIIVATVS